MPVGAKSTCCHLRETAGVAGMSDAINLKHERLGGPNDNKAWCTFGVPGMDIPSGLTVKAKVLCTHVLTALVWFRVFEHRRREYINLQVNKVPLQKKSVAVFGPLLACSRIQNSVRLSLRPKIRISFLLPVLANK